MTLTTSFPTRPSKLAVALEFRQVHWELFGIKTHFMSVIQQSFIFKSVITNLEDWKYEIIMAHYQIPQASALPDPSLICFTFTVT